jgi:glycosyltransferase involved in cell wall biosynthesis
MTQLEVKPTFSIIVPFFNESLYIKDTVLSLLSQQYSNFEVLFINDGSTDDTEKIILNISGNDTRIKIIKQSHLGKCIARNNGIQNASANWICFLNSGDTYFQNHLRLFSELIQANEGLSVFCTSELNGSNLKGFTSKKFWGQTQFLSFEDAIEYDRFSINQFCLRKDFLMENQFPSMNMIYAEDHLFICQTFAVERVLQKQTISVASKLKPRFEKDTLSINDKVNWTKLSSELFINNRKPAKAIKKKIERSTKLKIFSTYFSFGEFYKSVKALISYTLIYITGF